MLSRYAIIAAAGVVLGLLLSRKRGPFGIFAAIKNFDIFYPVTKCETCTTLWSSFIIYTLDVVCNYQLHWFGFNPSWDLIIGLLATWGLTLAIAGIAQSFVMHDS